MPATATELRCRKDHPAARSGRHMAFITMAPGEWEPTGRVIDVDPRDLEELRDVAGEMGYNLAYCPKCKAATEYRRAE